MKHLDHLLPTVLYLLHCQSNDAKQSRNIPHAWAINRKVNHLLNTEITEDHL